MDAHTTTAEVLDFLTPSDIRNVGTQGGASRVTPDDTNTNKEDLKRIYEAIQGLEIKDQPVEDLTARILYDLKLSALVLDKEGTKIPRVFFPIDKNELSTRGGSMISLKLNLEPSSAETILKKQVAYQTELMEDADPQMNNQAGIQSYVNAILQSGPEKKSAVFCMMGESGAGKTTNSEAIEQAIFNSKGGTTVKPDFSDDSELKVADFSKMSGATFEEKKSENQATLARICFNILEQIGNAQTKNNPNSSRFIRVTTYKVDIVPDESSSDSDKKKFDLKELSYEGYNLDIRRAIIHDETEHKDQTIPFIVSAHPNIMNLKKSEDDQNRVNQFNVYLRHYVQFVTPFLTDTQKQAFQKEAFRLRDGLRCIRAQLNTLHHEAIFPECMDDSKKSVLFAAKTFQEQYGINYNTVEKFKNPTSTYFPVYICLMYTAWFKDVMQFLNTYNKKLMQSHGSDNVTAEKNIKTIDIFGFENMNKTENEKNNKLFQLICNLTNDNVNQVFQDVYEKGLFQKIDESAAFQGDGIDLHYKIGPVLNALWNGLIDKLKASSITDTEKRKFRNIASLQEDARLKRKNDNQQYCPVVDPVDIFERKQEFLTILTSSDTYPSRNQDIQSIQNMTAYLKDLLFHSQSSQSQQLVMGQETTVHKNFQEPLLGEQLNSFDSNIFHFTNRTKKITYHLPNFALEGIVENPETIMNSGIVFFKSYQPPQGSTYQKIAQLFPQWDMMLPTGKKALDSTLLAEAERDTKTLLKLLHGTESEKLLYFIKCIRLDNKYSSAQAPIHINRNGLNKEETVRSEKFRNLLQNELETTGMIGVYKKSLEIEGASIDTNEFEQCFTTIVDPKDFGLLGQPLMGKLRVFCAKAGAKLDEDLCLTKVNGKIFMTEHLKSIYDIMKKQHDIQSASSAQLMLEQLVANGGKMDGVPRRANAVDESDVKLYKVKKMGHTLATMNIKYDGDAPNGYLLDEDLSTFDTEMEDWQTKYNTFVRNVGSSHIETTYADALMVFQAMLDYFYKDDEHRTELPSMCVPAPFLFLLAQNPDAVDAVWNSKLETLCVSSKA
eukprot:CAMPEP_0113889042 /NCGR_PEP_ID=MMETSP0780_2-20120614/13241_1 /TAXON_ID=652834 /ORGANISM="Palpitomonas bilix" /LENGTH=1058 /DNA_ID=CAMNT_0000878025 /DNA_START=981 /DNA_END=4158 /DNA_ORIENTATION=- /assembly_acc=CAM_ASM_000599